MPNRRGPCAPQMILIEAEWRIHASAILPSFVQIMACRLVAKLQWNSNLNSKIFIQENAFESVVCEMAFVWSRNQCVKRLHCTIICANFLQISINHMEYTLVVVQGFFNAYGNTTWEMFALVLQKDFSKWILFSKRFIEVCLVCFNEKKRHLTTFSRFYNVSNNYVWHTLVARWDMFWFKPERYSNVCIRFLKLSLVISWFAYENV